MLEYSNSDNDGSITRKIEIIIIIIIIIIIKIIILTMIVQVIRVPHLLGAYLK